MTVVVSLVNYAFSLLAVRILAPVDYATFASAQGLLLILGSGCMAAVPWAIARHVAVERSDAAAQTAMHFGLWAGFFQGLVFAVIGGCIMGEIGGALCGFATAAAAFLLSLVTAPLGFLQGEQRLERIAVLRILETAVRVAVGLGLLVWWGKNPQNAIWGFAVASALLLVLGLMSTKRAFPVRRGDRAILRGLLKESLSLGAIQVLIAMLASLDVVAIQFSGINPDTIPAYQVAALLGRIPLFISSAISMAFYPVMAQEKSEAACGEHLRTALRLYFLITLPGLALSFFLPTDLVKISSPGNAVEVGHLLRWTLVSSAALGLANVLTTAHQARARFDVGIALLIAPALLQVPLLLVGGHLFGVRGFMTTLVAVSLITSALVVIDSRFWSPWARSRRSALLAIAATLGLAAIASISFYFWCVALAFAAVAILADLGFLQRLRRTRGLTEVAAGQSPNSATHPSGQTEHLVEFPAHTIVGSGFELTHVHRKESLMDADILVGEPELATNQHGPRVAIVGDSWIAGLGCRREKAFGRLAAGLLGSNRVLDVAKVGYTVRDVIDHSLTDIEAFHPDILIASIGGTEGLVHPRASVQKIIERFFPEHWHGVAGLDPRVKYVAKGNRLQNQLRETRAKVRVKKIILSTVGGAPRVPLPIFEKAAREFLSSIKDLGVPVILVGFPKTDDRLFPGTNASMVNTNRVLRALAAEMGNVHYMFFDDLHNWDDFLDDHLHLGPSGHAKLAVPIAALGSEVLGEQMLAGTV